MGWNSDRPISGPALPEAPALSQAPPAFEPLPGDHARIDGAARAILAGTLGIFDADFATCGVPGPTIVVDPPTGSLDNSILRFLQGYWLGLARDGDLPPMRAVDPVDMREALGYVLLLDVQPGGDDFVYRLYGSGVAAIGGQDWTGWSVGAIGVRTKTNYERFYRAVYRASLLARKAIYTEHRAPDFQSAQAWQRLILPLVGSDGAVARFLVGNVPVGVRPLTAEQSAELARRLGPAT